jgi:hypothetical protein
MFEAFLTVLVVANALPISPVAASMIRVGVIGMIGAGSELP